MSTVIDALWMPRVSKTALWQLVEIRTNLYNFIVVKVGFIYSSVLYCSGRPS